MLSSRPFFHCDFSRWGIHQLSRILKGAKPADLSVEQPTVPDDGERQDYPAAGAPDEAIE